MDREVIRQGHIDRFLKGKDVWNAWAEEMLRDREKLEKAGKWAFSELWEEEIQAGLSLSGNPETQIWLERALVDFSSIHFFAEQSINNKVKGGEYKDQNPESPVKQISVPGYLIDFESFIFPGTTWFDKTKFTGDALFKGAKFNVDARFSRAEFTDDAWFDEAAFTGTAWFIDATFTGGAFFSGATFAGPAMFSKAKFTGEAKFYKAKFINFAWFDWAKFTDIVRCEEAEFTGEARFDGVEFTSSAWFYGTKFTDDALFSTANFTGETLFDGAKFAGKARFIGAKFTGEATFRRATFIGTASFNQTDFNSFTTFINSRFYQHADFEAINVERGFTLANVQFTSQVPSFIQAHFKEAPRLDNIAVITPPKKFILRRVLFLAWNIKKRPRWHFKSRLQEKILVDWIIRRLKAKWHRMLNSRRDKDEEARYRALKRLAVQAHDHDNEQIFFAGELRARRHVSDRLINFPVGTVRYLGGALYELTSDFGRSIWRPAFLWGVVFFLFTHLYLCQATAIPKGECINTAKLSPIFAAYIIAAKNSLQILALDGTDQVKRAYTCLYGASDIYKKVAVEPKTDRTKNGYKNIQLSNNLAPEVPWKVSALGILHSILSLGLIFLFFLALRNQFKIK